MHAKVLDERAKEKINGEVKNSKIEGRVEVGERTKIVNSIVRGPSVIGKNCLIENSYIGPYTSIGDDSKVVNSSAEYCVVLEGASIVGIERLEESLVGKHAKVTKHEGNRKILKLNIGDYSELEL